MEDKNLMIKFIISLMLCIGLLIFNLWTGNMLMAIVVIFITIIITLYYLYDLFKVKIMIVEDIDDLDEDFKDEDLKDLVKGTIKQELINIIMDITEFICYDMIKNDGSKADDCCFVKSEDSEEDCQIFLYLCKQYIFAISSDVEIKTGEPLKDNGLSICLIKTDEVLKLSKINKFAIDEVYDIEEFVDMALEDAHKLSDYIDELTAIYKHLEVSEKELEDANLLS